MAVKVPEAETIGSKRNRKYRGRPVNYRTAHRMTDERLDCWGLLWTMASGAFMIALCIVLVESAPFAAEQKARTQNRPAQREDSLNEKQIRLMESDIEQLTNKYREKTGLQPLRINPALTFLARKHNEHMCASGTLSHESKLFPEGWRRFSDRMQAVRVRSAGENIACGSLGKDPKQWAKFIVEGWMKSPAHRKNILNAGFNYLGVAVWECGGKIAYATQVFSSDIGQIPQGR